MKGLVAAMTAIALAGCFLPDIPADATRDTDEALPGLELAAWSVLRGDRVQLHAVASNDHDEGYWYRINCGHPWNVTLTGPEGPVGFRQVPEPGGCAPQYEILQPKQHLGSLWSWDLRDHDIEEETSRPVPDGTYWWNVTLGVRDHDARLHAAFIVTLHEGVPATRPATAPAAPTADADP